MVSLQKPVNCYSNTTTGKHLLLAMTDIEETKKSKFPQSLLYKNNQKYPYIFMFILTIVYVRKKGIYWKVWD